MAKPGLLSAMTALCVVWMRARGQNMKGDIWGLASTTDAVAASYFLTLPTSTATLCGAQCTLHPACRSFTYSAGQSLCWLYDHLVEYSTNSIPAPGTRSFWSLSPRCPTELDYVQSHNVCYKIYGKMSWTEAKETCRRDGATLFVGDSAAKLATLYAHGLDQIWVGAFKDAVTGDWFFIDGTRLPTDSELWDPEQPDNAFRMQNITRLSNLGGLDDTLYFDACYTACQIPVV